MDKLDINISDLYIQDCIKSLVRDFNDIKDTNLQYSHSYDNITGESFITVRRSQNDPLTQTFIIGWNTYKSVINNRLKVYNLTIVDQWWIDLDGDYFNFAGNSNEPIIKVKMKIDYL